MKKAHIYTTVILIFLFFGLCIANVLICGDDFSENENRYLAKFPDVSLKSLADGNFMKDFDSYACDRFIFRDFFVSFKAGLERISLKKENNGVYFGKDGYLIPVFNKNEEITDKNINAIKKLCETEKFRTTLCVVPTAFEVKKDKLPVFAYNNDEKKTLDKINNAFKEEKIEVVKPLNLLSLYKDEYIYYKTDHHQTAKGGYLMYRCLSEALGYTPFNENAFNIKTVSKSFYGTSWSKAMTDGFGPDEIQVYEHKQKKKITIDKGSLYDYSKLKTKDKYAFFLGGNNGLVKIKSSVGNGKKLAIIKDSYANNIVPFLVNHFEEIYFIDLRYFNEDIFEVFYKNNIRDVAVLCGVTTFSTDESLAKIESLTKTSEYLKMTGGLVEKSGQVNDGYFNNAVFIGDSLTDGLRLYANTPGLFLCNTGVNISDISSFSASTGNNIIEEIKNTSGDKFYIMLGINDNIFEESMISEFIRKYGYFIDMIREYHPKSIIYIQSMLPVSKEKENTSRFKNSIIYKCNNELLKLAIEKNVYYLNVAEEFKDGNGYLKNEISVDGVHFKTPYYANWYNYLKNHIVPVEGNGEVYSSVNTPAFIGGGKYELDKLADKLVKEVKFKDTLSIVGINAIKFLYDIEPEKLINGQVRAGGGATAEEIAIFEYLPDMKNEVAEKIQKRIKNKRKAYESYMPKEMAKLKNPVVIITDNYAVICICDNNKQAEKIIKNFF